MSNCGYIFQLINHVSGPCPIVCFMFMVLVWVLIWELALCFWRVLIWDLCFLAEEFILGKCFDLVVGNMA